MKLKNIIIATAMGCALPVVMSSCSHEEIDLYSGPKAGIFIQEVASTDLYGNPQRYKEGTTGITFATYGSHVTGLNTYLTIRTMGAPVDYDRPYKLVLDPEETTAVEGVDFSFEGHEFCIKAGESTDRITVKLIRHAGLLQRTVRIYFRLEPNEHFDMPISEYKNSASWNQDGDMLPTDHFFIEFGENYACPNYWNSFGKSYFGDWTVTKYLLVNEQLGWTVTDWSNAGMTGSKVALGRFGPGAKIMQNYLQSMADAGSPVLDPDDPSGYMQLAASYQVNYGAYLTPQN